MLASITSSGLIVGDDPNMFEVAEGGTTWGDYPRPAEARRRRRSSSYRHSSELRRAHSSTSESYSISRLYNFFRGQGRQGDPGGASPSQSWRGRRFDAHDDPLLKVFEVLLRELERSLTQQLNAGPVRSVVRVPDGRLGSTFCGLMVSSCSSDSDEHYDGFESRDGADDTHGIVHLDLLSVQFLRQSLERGGFLETSRGGRRRDVSVGAGGDRGSSAGEGEIEIGSTSSEQFERRASSTEPSRLSAASVDSQGINSVLGSPDALPLSRRTLALLRKLYQLSRAVTALRVSWGEYGSPSALRRRVELQTFPSLQDLRLEGVPLEHIAGLFSLRLQLKSLRFEESLLAGVFALLGPDMTSIMSAKTDKREKGLWEKTRAQGPGDSNHGKDSESSWEPGESTEMETETETEVFDSAELEGLRSSLGTGTPLLHWSLLQVLSVCHSGLRELDASLRLLPRVQRLSLSHNRLVKVDFLQDCASLEELDVSFNRLESLDGIHRVLGNLRSINLRGNLLQGTAGLDRVLSLEEVNLASNRIRGLEEAGRLSRLPLLQGVRLEGNPLESEEGKGYRLSVLSLLNRGRGLGSARSRVGTVYPDGVPAPDEAAGVALDGRYPSRSELAQLIRHGFERAVQSWQVPVVDATLATLPDGQGGDKRDDAGHLERPGASLPSAESRPAWRGEGTEEVYPVAGLGGHIVKAPIAQQVAGFSTQGVEHEQHSFPVAVMAESAAVPHGVYRLRSSGKRGDGSRGRLIGRGVGSTDGGFSRGSMSDSEEVRAKAVGSPGVRGALGPASNGESISGAASDSGATTGRRRHGRRRGTRTATIEDPSSTGAAGWEKKPEADQASLSFCTVPLPDEDVGAEAVADDGKDLHVVGVLASSRSPEVVPEAEVPEKGRVLPSVLTVSGGVLHMVPQPGTSDKMLSGVSRQDSDARRGPGKLPSLSSVARSPDAGVYMRNPAEGTEDVFVKVNEQSASEVVLDKLPDAQVISVRSSSMRAAQRSQSWRRGAADRGVRTAEGSAGAAAVAGAVGSASDPWSVAQQSLGERSSVSSGVMSRPASVLGIQGVRPDGDALDGAATAGDMPPAVAASGLSDGGASVSSGQDDRRGLSVQKAEQEELEEESYASWIPESLVLVQPRWGGRVAGGLGMAGVADQVEDGYRGDVAYSSLSVAEHLELYCRQQLFNGTPYLDYGTDPPSLIHPSLSLGAPHNVVAVFRETALPCVPHRYASASADASAAGSLGPYDGRVTVVTGTMSDGKVLGSPLSPTASDAAEEKAGEKEMAETRKTMEIVEILGGLGLGQAVHHRDVSGEARGATMGEVTCVVVATETAIFVLDGVYDKREMTFSEAPRPRVFLVAPLESLARTTIGFRLQKLELHFTLRISPTAAQPPPISASASGTDWDRSMEAWEGFDGGLEGMSEHGRGNTVRGGSARSKESGREGPGVSLVLMTRDRSRTFNVLQTLEPLGTTCRRARGLPEMTVENRDIETLEAIAKALPRGPGDASASAMAKRKPKPVPASSNTVAVMVELEPVPSTPSGHDSDGDAGAQASPDRNGKPGILGKVGGWARDTRPAGTALPIRGTQVGADASNLDASVTPGESSPDGQIAANDGTESLLREEEQGDAPVAHAISLRATCEGGERPDPSEADGGAGSPALVATSSSVVKAPPGTPPKISPEGPTRGSPDAGLKMSVSRGATGPVGVSDPMAYSLRGDGSDGTVVVFQLLMQRWKSRPWTAAPRTLVATREQVALMHEDHIGVQASVRLLALHGNRERVGSQGSSSPSNASILQGRSLSSLPGSRMSSFSSAAGEAPDVGGRSFRSARGRMSTSPPAYEGMLTQASDDPGDGAMYCVDVAELSDVVGVRQESKAPEQLTIELGRDDRRRKWRLQCRTRGSAELLVSILRRISLERMAQKKQGGWWRR